jgi:hypothetical protein
VVDILAQVMINIAAHQYISPIAAQAALEAIRFNLECFGKYNDGKKSEQVETVQTTPDRDYVSPGRSHSRSGEKRLPFK